MTEVIAQMHVHTTSFLHSIGIDRMALESEGLGIRPLITVENVAQRDRNILARRFYRLAQWTELVQGSFWLTVSVSRSLSNGAHTSRMPSLRSTGIIHWLTS